VIIIKSKEEIELIREGGFILAYVLKKLAEFIRPGITTWAIDKKVEEMIREKGARPAFKGYKPRFASEPYRFATCVSVNEEVVHGLPSKKRVLKEGDIVSVDVGVLYKGYYSDAAYTYSVGEVEERIKLLLEVTKSALYKGIEKAVIGNRVGDISYAIGSYVKSYGFNPIKDYCGHGVGKHLHEDPSIPNDGEPGKGEPLKEGMVIAIEPMVAIGSGNIMLKNDGWTAVTSDGSYSAHFEHTVAIFRDGPKILTPWDI
jgi:methionyl aminopeptidase